jgi:hypothetical protein
MSELEGSQAHLHKPPKLKGAQLTAQGWPPLLFIAPQTNIAVGPFTGRISGRPDVLHRVRLLTAIHVSPCVQRRPRDPNGHFHANGQEIDRTRHLHRPDAQVTHSTCAREAPTGRAAELTGRVTPGVRFESSKGPLATGRATASDRPRDLQTL